MMLMGYSVYFCNFRPKQVVALQHFASGILIAAVAFELAPQLSKQNPISICLGYLVAVGFLMFVGRFEFKRHCHKCTSSGEMRSPLLYGEVNGEWTKAEGTDQDGRSRNSLPLGLIAAVMNDGFIDGLLISVSYVGSRAAGIITALAISVEMGLLGISTANRLKRLSISTWKCVLITTCVPWCIMVGGMTGALATSNLNDDYLVAVIAFGVAGLLYLVTEELMIEAHLDEETDRWYVSVWFFAGFLFVVMMDHLMEQM